MNSKTRIIVVKLKELIMTALLVALAIVLIVLLFIAFSNKSSKATKVSNAKYTAGVYSSYVTLNGNPVDIQVTVDDNNINSIELLNVTDAVTTMYPLIQTSFQDISQKVCETGSTKNITFDSESTYTTTMLLNAIDNALNKCTIN